MNKQEEATQEMLEEFQNKILGQVEKEYKLCLDSQKPKLNEWLTRLKIYNNQRKNKSAVGDPLLFTVFQTILASLYDDGLKVEFLPREEGDIDVAENLNLLADHDNDEMQKDELDYEWDWDAMFFGRGINCMMEFDFDKKCPSPEIWSPLTFLRDPEARSVNGDTKGRGACRFIGREVNQLLWKLKESPAYFNLEKLKDKGSKSKQDSLIEKKEQSRREAQGLTKIVDENVGDNTYFRTIQWFTFIDGERYFVEIANDMSTLIRFQKLKDQDSWPLVDRALFPMAGDWDGVSIPDLIEDKQRARAVLLNAGLETAKANSGPMYLFDQNRIKRRDQLNFEFNKFVPVDGPPRDAVVPMVRDQVKQETQFIFQLLDESAQRALATPELQQGASPRRARTLGELELMSAKVDTRYSLAAKIFGWSEKRFWRKWYSLYKSYFSEGISEKIVRLTGVFGPEFRNFSREDIITGKYDPDVKIESEALVKAQKAIDTNKLGEFLGFGSQLPGFNIRYVMREMGRLSGYSKGKIDQMLPPTYDEITANQENSMMNDGKNPRVLLTDQHLEHIAIHAKAKEGDERKKHIETHHVAIRLIHENPEVFDPSLIGEGSSNPMESPGAPPPTGEETMPGAQPQPKGRSEKIPQSYTSQVPPKI